MGFDKVWLDRLPIALPPENVYDVTGSEIIFVFIIFDSEWAGFFVRSGCHARRSWLMHSDAEEFGVRFCFYVEESAKDLVTPIFYENHVDVDLDVIFFADVPDKPDTNMRDHHRKKASFLIDLYFKDYKWVIVSDCDFFLSRGVNWDGNKLPVFQWLMEREATVCGVTGVSDVRTPLDFWANKLFRYDSIALSRLHLHNMLDGMMASDDLIKITVELNALRLVHTGVFFFPSNFFMTSEWDNCCWLYDVTHMCDSFEFALALYWELGGEVWGFQNEYGVPCVFRDVRDAFETYSLFFTHPHKQAEDYCSESSFRKSIGLA